MYIQSRLISPSTNNNSPSKPIGHYMYRQFNIQQIQRSAPHGVFVCFVCIWEQTAIISWLLGLLYKVKRWCITCSMSFRLSLSLSLPTLSIVSAAIPSDRFLWNSVYEYFEKNNLSSRSVFHENRRCLESEGRIGNVSVPLQGVLIGTQNGCVYCAVRTEFLIVI